MKIFKWLICGVTFESISFWKLFLSRNFEFPLPDLETFDSPLKNFSPASENVSFPPWKFQNFFPTLNLGWERHSVNSQNLFTECRYLFARKSYANPKKAGFPKYRENPFKENIVFFSIKNLPTSTFWEFCCMYRAKNLQALSYGVFQQSGCGDCFQFCLILKLWPFNYAILYKMAKNDNFFQKTPHHFWRTPYRAYFVQISAEKLR